MLTVYCLIGSNPKAVSNYPYKPVRQNYVRAPLTYPHAFWLFSLELKKTFSFSYPWTTVTSCLCSTNDQQQNYKQNATQSDIRPFVITILRVGLCNALGHVINHRLCVHFHHKASHYQERFDMAIWLTNKLFVNQNVKIVQHANVLLNVVTMYRHFSLVEVSAEVIKSTSLDPSNIKCCWTASCSHKEDVGVSVVSGYKQFVYMRVFSVY